MGKYTYECDCHNCDKIKWYDQPEQHRHGYYCSVVVDSMDAGAVVETVRATDDYRITCGHFQRVGAIDWKRIADQLKQ